jgi:outer membrane biosynthesis protein TonB
MHHSIGMFLAGILALCMLFAVFCPGSASGAAASAATNNLGLSQQQTPPPSSPPAAQAPHSPPTAPAAPEKSSTPSKHKRKKKPDQPPPAADPATAPPKKVVSHGSTEAPTTHLTPSMTDEQGAKTKATNEDLLNQAGANLQKVSSRSLAPEQQETADQVRKFMEQSRAADQEGDLQRAGTLANKAKLLSDSLEQTSRPPTK